MSLPTLEEIGLAPKVEVNIDDFTEVRECDYKNEHYSVRDNGAVMRHPKEGKNPRPTDNEWTFGKRNASNGYMLFGSHRVHIICAIAFHGEHDSRVFVVDHIDTNRCNNRKENLRWLTRLENALNNPITRKRIEWLCGGDIQKFIADPSCLQTNAKSADLEWMRTVTPDEAKNAKENLERWAKKPIFVPDPDLPKINVKRDKEWMYKKPKPIAEDNRTPEEKEAQAKEWYRHLVLEQHAAALRALESDKMPNYVQATTPDVAGQVNWNTPTRFPCCPTQISDDVLVRYADALVKDAVFCENDLWISKVVSAKLIDDGKRLAIMTVSPGGIKQFAVAVIYVKGDKIIHETYGTYFSETGGEKAMVELQGLEWTGEDCIDDYC